MATKGNYYTRLKEAVQNIQTVEYIVGDLQRALLSVKEVTPPQKIIHVNAATTALSLALKQFSIARDKILNHALKVMEDVAEAQDKNVFNVPITNIYVRQTDYAPIQRFELRPKPTSEAVTHVALYDKTGEWKCYACENTQGPCSHVEQVRAWIENGRPVLNNDVDTKAFPDGYERPPFQMTDKPIGYPERGGGPVEDEKDN